MVNVGKVLSSPMLRKRFTILRNSGIWQNGRYVVEESSIAASGPVTLGNSTEIQVDPEGDRVLEVTHFFSRQPMYLTSAKDGLTSDIILYKDEKYRILKVSKLEDYGYYMAEATIMGGE